MDISGLTTLVCVTVLTLETTATVLASSYVIFIILLNFFKKKHLNAGQKIQMALALSNIRFSILTSVGIFSGFFWPVISRTTSAISIFFSFTMYCICSGFWLRTCLSFLYFIKIVNIKTKCFIWIKTNISSIVSWAILGAEIASFGSFCSVFFQIIPQPTSSNTSVYTYSAVVVSEVRRSFLCTVIVVNFLPFLVVFVTTFTTAVVLKEHRAKMEKTVGSSSNVNLETYKMTFFRLLQLLFFNSLFFVVILIFFSSVFAEMSPGFWVSLVIMYSFCPVHIILIILNNPKLKRSWKELTKQVRSCRQ